MWVSVSKHRTHLHIVLTYLNHHVKTYPSQMPGRRDCNLFETRRPHDGTFTYNASISEIIMSSSSSLLQCRQRRFVSRQGWLIKRAIISGAPSRLLVNLWAFGPICGAWWYKLCLENFRSCTRAFFVATRDAKTTKLKVRFMLRLHLSLFIHYLWCLN